MLLFYVIVMCVPMMAISLYAAIWPERMWYLSHGWMYKNVEPSDLALRMPRIGGIIGLIISTVFLIWFTIDLLIGK